MNGPIEFENGRQRSMPAFLQSVLKSPRLLPGENPADYDVICQLMIIEVSPQSNIEWLWTIDLIELSWDVIRYRSLREKVLEIYRGKAIEALLQEVDGWGISPSSQALARRQIRRNAEQLRNDPDAAIEIEGRLKLNGIGAASINVEVFVQARDLFVMFDSLLISAQSRRVALLREIAARRVVTKQARTLPSKISGCQNDL